MSKSNNISEVYEGQEKFEITVLPNNVPNELDRLRKDDGEQHEKKPMELKQPTAVEPKE